MANVAERGMNQGENRVGHSVLIIKPEFFALPPEDQIRLFGGILEEYSDQIVSVHRLKLTPGQAQTLWANIDHYPWAPRYYEHVCSGEIRVIVLEGENTANRIKSEVRARFQEQIEHLSSGLNSGFSADLIHGSDPDNGERESQILKIA